MGKENVSIKDTQNHDSTSRIYMNIIVLECMTDLIV